MNDLKLQFYRIAFMQIKRGNNRGVNSNAKPIFCLSLIEAIETGVLETNEISFIDERIHKIYLSQFNYYCPNSTITPIAMPFFHCNREPFFSIEWNNITKPPMQAHSPSARFLRENVKYARFENALWDLLQDKECRQTLRNVIIQSFLIAKQ